MRRRVTTLESSYTIEAVALSTVGHLLIVAAISLYGFFLRQPPDVPEVAYEFMSQQEYLEAISPPVEQAEEVPLEQAQQQQAETAQQDRVEQAQPEQVQPAEELPPPVESVQPDALPPPPPEPVQQAQRPEPEVANRTPLVEPTEAPPPSMAEEVRPEAAPTERADVVEPEQVTPVEREVVQEVQPEVVQPEPPRPPEVAEEVIPEEAPVEEVQPAEPVEAQPVEQPVEPEPAEETEVAEVRPVPPPPAPKPKDIPKIDPPPQPEPEPEPQDPLASVLNRVQQLAQNQPTQQSRPAQRQAAPGQRLNVAERRALVSYISGRFKVDCGTKYPEQHQAVLDIQLLSDGRIQSVEYSRDTLQRATVDPFAKRFAEAARRAVFSSQPFPYDILKSEKYADWREMELTFVAGDLCG